MQHVIFVKLAVFRKNWSREELCVTQQGAPADCQHHNWGRCSLYLGIQFSFDSLILYNLLFWFFNDHSRFWTDLIILGWFEHFQYLDPVLYWSYPFLDWSHNFSQFKSSVAFSLILSIFGLSKDEILVKVFFYDRQP